MQIVPAPPPEPGLHTPEMGRALDRLRFAENLLTTVLRLPESAYKRNEDWGAEQLLALIETAQEAGAILAEGGVRMPQDQVLRVPARAGFEDPWHAFCYRVAPLSKEYHWFWYAIGAREWSAVSGQTVFNFINSNRVSIRKIQLSSPR